MLDSNLQLNSVGHTGTLPAVEKRHISHQTRHSASVNFSTYSVFLCCPQGNFTGLMYFNTCFGVNILCELHNIL
jgi:hypothetical protein